MKTMQTTHRTSFLTLLAIAVALLLNASPARASDTDARIESSAAGSYVFKTFLKDDAIAVKSKDGAVTLTGSVNEDYHKALAAETVANLPGVKSVDNRLELKSATPAELSDAWVGMKVKSSLLFHRNVSGSTTEVHVQEGIVTLRGEAVSQAQKDLVTEYAQDIEGVKSVKNEMTVPKGPVKSFAENVGDTVGSVVETIDDASVTALVKMTLLYHRSTSGLATKVVTNNGIVTLSGTAKTAVERDLATKYTEDVYGVKGVKNIMTLE